MFSMNICEPFVLSLASREECYLVSLLNHGKGVGAGGTIILLSKSVVGGGMVTT